MSNPTAHISVQKSRLKHYKTKEDNYPLLKDDNNSYYLDDKQTFEIELFNPLSETIAAEIYLNDKLISISKLLIKPGQRVWLERFLDKNAKFIFETYTVSGKDKEIKKAIENNGNISINFYKEKSIYSNTSTYVRYPDYNPYNSYNPWVGTGSPSWTPNTFTCNTIADIQFDGNTSNSINLNSANINKSTKSLKRSITKENQKETGRIEQGNISEQDLHSVDIDLETYSFYSIQIKLKPLSERFLTDKDIKRYCPECGLRIRNKKWRHCTVCGTRL